MSFKMIREAQAIARLGDKAPFAQTIQKIIGSTSVTAIEEAFDQKQFEVTPEHYNQWLSTIVDMAAERGISLTKRQNFNDLAFDILDNDSLVDALGGDTEKTKLNILKALWQAYQVSKAHTKVQDHVGEVIQKTREEEEQVAAPRVRTQPLYQKAIATPGARNPYPAGTLRAALWDDAHKTNASTEEEEYDDVEDEMPSAEEVPADDTAAMSPDDLASHITGEPRADAGEGEPDLEARVDDLEDRLADLEHQEEIEHNGGDEAVSDDMGDEMGDEELPAIVDDEADMPREEKPAARPAPARGGMEKGFDEEEQVKSMFRQAITSPKEHLQAALKDVEAEGAKAWAKMQLASNPHPKKSPAYHAWAKGFKNSAKAGLGIVDKPASTSKPKKR